MIIGNFRYEAEADTYTGEIRTLQIYRSHVVLRPVRKTNEREPDYRVVQHAEGGTVELGAAWQRQSDKGLGYLSVLLDDPALPQPLSVAMFSGEDDRTASLVWNRSARKAPEPVSKPKRQPVAGGRRRETGRAPTGPS